jgi:hypothetical protein
MNKLAKKTWRLRENPGGRGDFAVQFQNFLQNQYFTKIERMPKIRGVGVRPLP